MNDSKVTVIITTYKRNPEIVLRAVNSVRRQTYQNLEIIIVDDSPDDYSLRSEVRKSIEALQDHRIIYLCNECNIGACASRNCAIDRSTGAFIMYVDDDDEILEECVEKRVAKFDHSDVGLVYSDCYILDDSKNIKKRVFQEKHRGFVFDQLIIKNFIYAFPMVKKECFDVCGKFDIQMLAAQDYEMWLRIAEKYQIDYVDEPLAIVHLHAGERISTNPYKKIQGLERIHDIYQEYLNKHKYANHIRIIKLVPFYLLAGNVKYARKVLIKGIALQPFDIAINAKYLKLYILSRLKQHEKN